MSLITITGDVWNAPEIRRTMRTSKGSGLYAVAYVTRAMSGMFASGDILVCDASEKAVSSGETDPRTLLTLLREGVRIYSREALHAKCAVWLDAVLVGSANMSESSATRLHELSVFGKDQSLADQIHCFISRIIENADEMDEKSLKVLRKFIKKRAWQCALPKRLGGNRLHTALPVKNHGNRFFNLGDGGQRIFSEKEIENSHDKAVKMAEKDGQLSAHREMDVYFNWYKYVDGRLCQGDSFIVVTRGENGRKMVYGPCTVVFVKKKGTRRMVQYVRPKKGVPYGKFKNDSRIKRSVPFEFRKDIDRRLDDELFSLFTQVLKSYS